jgi:hypothetical protein
MRSILNIGSQIMITSSPTREMDIKFKNAFCLFPMCALLVASFGAFPVNAPTRRIALLPANVTGTAASAVAPGI